MLKLKMFSRDQDGTSVTEFGLIAPAMMIMTMGTFDAGYSYYVESVMTGQMNELARSSSLEGSTTTIDQCLVDNRIKRSIKSVVPTAKVLAIDCSALPNTYTRKYALEQKSNRTAAENTELANIVEALREDIKVQRRYYKTFSKAAAAQAETLIKDTNGNFFCDPDDTFVDANNNDTWDSDGGDDGQGGAKDVVIINVSVKMPRLFPVSKLIGLSSEQIWLSDSILANQPYGVQSEYGPATTGTC
jgi:Flp pilus assembly protein TadG